MNTESGSALEDDHLFGSQLEELSDFSSHGQVFVKRR